MSGLNGRRKTEFISVHFSKIKWELHNRLMGFMWTDRKNKKIIRIPYKCLGERYSLKWSTRWTLLWETKHHLHVVETSNSLWTAPLFQVSPSPYIRKFGGGKILSILFWAVKEKSFPTWWGRLCLPYPQQVKVQIFLIQKVIVQQRVGCLSKLG